MTQKEARKIMLWKAIERYRTAGGREEHHAYKEALDNYIDGMLDVSEMDEVAHRFAHPLALELECVLADRNANWDRAMNLIGEYRSAMNAIHEQHSPTHMGEPLRHNSIADVHEAARLLEAARALPVDGLDAEPVQPNRDWDHIDDVLPVIELMRSGKWVWDENMRCKYVEVRIDTRDGGCIIKDRHDVRITPAELVKQFDGRGGLSWTEYDEIFSPPIAKQQEPS